MRIIATIMLLMALASEYEPLGVKLQKGEKNSYDAQVRTQWSHMSYGWNCMAALVTLHEDKLICFPELQARCEEGVSRGPQKTGFAGAVRAKKATASPSR